MAGSIQIRKRFGDRPIEQRISGEVEYLSFPLLDRTGHVSHLVSTRVGGVSEGIFSTMNLSFSRGDEPERVAENYRRIAMILGCESGRIVATQQTHTVNIRKVTSEDAGKGVTRERDYTDIDGLITDVPGLALAAFTADCVPVFFVDPIHRAIGVAHSGWRGTAGRIGAKMVERMAEEYGTKAGDLICAIGPSICQDCYEVSKDVADVFSGEFADDKDIIEELITTKHYKRVDSPTSLLLPGRNEEKFQLDLWLANAAVLRRAGVPMNNIAVTDICTCCNPDYLFSHRASQGRRGNLGAFLMLKEA